MARRSEAAAREIDAKSIFFYLSVLLQSNVPTRNPCLFMEADPIRESWDEVYECVYQCVVTIIFIY